MSQPPKDGGGPSYVAAAQSDDASQREARLGLLAAIGAYGSWGILTLFYSHLSHVPPLEVVSHRVAWSVLVLSLFFVWRRRWGEVWHIFRTPRILFILLATSILISVNWLTYIWAVSNGRATEASLGYFIVPLVNVAMGYLMLSERLSRWQGVAIMLAVLAIGLQFALLGTIPVVSLTLAASFGLYGYLRKIVPVGANIGLLIELILISPFAVGFLIYVNSMGEGHLFGYGTKTTLLLLLTGFVTYLPLMWFSAAAQRLRMSTIGVLQYMNPTIQFLVAVFLLGEVVSTSKLITFVLIWLSVLIYCYDVLTASRRQKRKAAIPPS
nr:EamA family transporter RarD [uncultured Cohaesibacter sp.]